MKNAWMILTEPTANSPAIDWARYWAMVEFLDRLPDTEENQELFRKCVGGKLRPWEDES